MVIGDGEILYRYADPAILPEGQTELPASIFNDKEMSCDWSQLQLEPEESYHVQIGRKLLVSIAICDGIRNPENPKRSGQKVEEWRQEIVHDPLAAKADDPFTPNPSHALIKGKKKSAVTSVIKANSTHRILP